MITKTLTQNEIQERRKKFFEESNKEYPHITDFVITSSGIIEPKPETQEAWDNFHENLQFVEGTERGG